MKNKIIDFQIMKINRNAQKICKCKPPQYEIDTTNKLVQCTKCNAYIHPFDALVGLSENIEWYNEEKIRLNKERNELIEKKNEYIKEINALHTKRFRMNVFRTLQGSYIEGLMPHCPHCSKPFDPTEIDRYTNKDYCDYKRKKSRDEKVSYIVMSKKHPTVHEMDSEWERVEKLTDEELDKEIEKIKKWSEGEE
ncbi:hypothetical protein CIW83_09485 [Tissierella sp. P1]|uniref:hypothetical protein n=1 Tax=Tissierella sp. P1 TaxID=1280483 RepID=UPI000BA07797|nr:hypothetical protein [Tissierella sp. P1]OZV12318.1 hypothetical protein CIW83_09485 [Tissierella sp. P1]